MAVANYDESQAIIKKVRAYIKSMQQPQMQLCWKNSPNVICLHFLLATCVSAQSKSFIKFLIRKSDSWRYANQANPKSVYLIQPKKKMAGIQLTQLSRFLTTTFHF